MTISNTSRTAGPFIGNGITQTFPFSFKVFSRSDLLVAQTVTATGVETIKTLDADYAVTLNSNQDANPGGVITMLASPPAGTTLAVTSNIPLVQSLDLTNQGGFYPKVINDALDRVIINVQQLAGRIGQGLSIGAAATTDQALAALALVQQISGGNGASLIGFLRDGAGSIATTLAKLLGWQRPSIFEFMTAAQVADAQSGTGALDAYAAIQAAIDATSGLLRAPKGRFRLSAQLIIRGDCTGIVGEGSYNTTFDKRFNGNAISCLTNGAVLKDFGIAGNGATYTGGGILPEGYNTVMKRLRIDDTADSCILFKPAVGTNASAGTYSSVNDCFLRPTNAATTMAIRSTGSDDPTRPTCRTFTKISGGSSLVDFSGMNYATLTDSLGTMVKFSGTSGKIHMRDNRLTCQANITIYGVDHVIDNNSWGFGAGYALTIDATTANVNFGAGNAISIGGSYGQAIKIGAPIGNGNPNYVHSELTAYPFGWYGTTSNAVLGDAVANAYYKLSGSLCFTTLNLVVGSTTNVAAGVYTFQLPFKAYVTALGSALVRTSTGTYYEATFIVQGGGSVGIVYLVPAATNPWDSTMLALGPGASFNMTIVYEVATA